MGDPIEELYQRSLDLSETDRAKLAARIIAKATMTDEMKADCALQILTALPLRISVAAVQKMMARATH